MKTVLSLFNRLAVVTEDILGLNTIFFTSVIAALKSDFIFVNNAALAKTIFSLIKYKLSNVYPRRKI